MKRPLVIYGDLSLEVAPFIARKRQLRGQDPRRCKLNVSSVNLDLEIASLEREAAASPNDRLLQRSLETRLLRAGRQAEVRSRLAARLHCEARWGRLTGGDTRSDGRVEPRRCSCCQRPAALCMKPSALLELARQGHCIATSHELVDTMIDALVTDMLHDDYREPGCLMPVYCYGQLTISGTEAQTAQGQRYRIFDIEGRFADCDRRDSALFYEQLQIAADHFDFVIVTLDRLHSFDEGAFSHFVTARASLQERGGDFFLCSLPLDYVEALQMLIGSVFESTYNIFADEQSAINAMADRKYFR
jgi:anti-anti-sigma regulatory factor